MQVRERLGFDASESVLFRSLWRLADPILQVSKPLFKKSQA
jgi:hypothetical protein